MIETEEDFRRKKAARDAEREAEKLAGQQAQPTTPSNSVTAEPIPTASVK